MKITFLTPHINISGGIKIILGYADRLSIKGHGITVLCPMPTFIMRRIRNFGIPLPKRILMNLSNHKPDWIRFRGKIKYVPSFKEKYVPDADIVVATTWQNSTYVANYDSSKGKKIYLFQHYERLFSDGCDDVDTFSYNLPLKKITISSCLKQKLKESFAQDSIFIPNPIDHNVFYPTRDKYNNEKRICMLYHTAEWKGFMDGLKAFKIAKKCFPTISLVLFGPRELNMNIDSEYHFRPTNDEVSSIYNSCDIFLCPSWREGFGLPSAEAMACRCAVVTTDNGGCRDYAIHNKTALLSPAKDPFSLAKNLLHILGDEVLHSRIAQKGYEHIQKFTWENSITQMENLFLSELEA